MAEYAVHAGGRTRLVRVTGDGPELQVSVDGQSVPVRLEPVVGSTQFHLTVGALHRPAVIRRHGGEIVVTLDDEQYRLRVEPAAPITRRARAASASLGVLTAPIPGLIVSVNVAEGDRVEQGRPLVVMEAMKMQSELKAALPGIVTAVNVRAGQEVTGGAVLVTITPAGTGNGEQGTGIRDKG